MYEQPVVREEVVKQCSTNCACMRCCVKCFSWSAIVVGALVAIGLGFLMNLFGIAIGLSAFKTSNEGIKTLAIGGYFGLLIGSIAIMFFAGWISGYLGRHSCTNRDVGALYGFTTWCLAFLFTVLITSHMGHFTAHAGDSLDYSKGYGNYDVYSTNNPDAPMVSQGIRNNDMKNHDIRSSNTNTVVVNEEKAAHFLGLSLLLTFVLFFVGALSACFGGYCGIARCHTCRDKHQVDKNQIVR